MKKPAPQRKNPAGAPRQIPALNQKLEPLGSSHAQAWKAINIKRAIVERKRAKTDSKERGLRQKVERVIWKAVEIIEKNARVSEKINKIQGKAS